VKSAYLFAKGMSGSALPLAKASSVLSDVTILNWSRSIFGYPVKLAIRLFGNRG
jgi:hypothetical protein